ncbi:MAG: hypothetical protein ACTHN5_19780 [Phycisphaerae bacterium]
MVKAGAAVVASGAATQEILARVQTFGTRATFTERGQSNPSRTVEEYWDRDRGCVKKEIFPGGTYVTRDDGKTSIRYREGRSVAAPEGGYNVPENFSKFVGLNMFGTGNETAVRVPERDRKEEQGGLFCYRVTEARGMTLMEWKNAHGMMVENEFSVPGTSEIVHGWQMVNPVLPADFWERPASVKLVEPRLFVGARYPLEKALFSKEAGGVIAAVHSVRQDENGVFYLVVSTRMTDEGFRALANVKTPQGGRLLRYTMTRLLGWDEKAKKPASRAYQDREIAMVQCEGIWVGYVVVVPRDEAAAERCRLCFPVVSMKRPEEFLGDVPREKVYVGFDLASQGKCGLEAFAGEAYDAMDAVDGMDDVRLEVSRGSGGRERGIVPPVEMTKEEFEERVGVDVGRMGVP